MNTNYIAGGGGILGRRRKYMNEIKPYDHEVEYLESSSLEGRPFINTGCVIYGLEYDIKIKFMMLEGLFEEGGFGVFSNYNTGYSGYINCYRITKGDSFTSQKSLACLNGSINTTNTYFYPTEYNKCYEIEMKGDGNLFYNGQFYAEMPRKSASLNSDDPILLFVAHPTWYNSNKIRIYSFSIKKHNETIIDLIPVRKGSEGFMYDKVSGKLFGNSGTGRFIIGPDID